MRLLLLNLLATERQVVFPIVQLSEVNEGGVGYTLFDIRFGNVVFVPNGVAVLFRGDRYNQDAHHLESAKSSGVPIVACR
jgi:hypothetical protein